MNAEQKRLATMLLGTYAKDKQITVQNEVSSNLVSALKDGVHLDGVIRRAIAEEVCNELLKKSRIQWADSTTSFSKRFRADAWIFTPEEIAELALDCYEAGLRSKEVVL